MWSWGRSHRSTAKFPPKYYRRLIEELVSGRIAALVGSPQELLEALNFEESSNGAETGQRTSARPNWQTLLADAKRLAGQWQNLAWLATNYFGDRVLACVFTSRLCLSTTRRNSRSIVLNASWTTLLSGWCEP